MNLNEERFPQQVEALEKFVCQVYCKNGPQTLPKLRWKLFRSKNLEGEMLPPTRGALLLRIIRSNFISRRDKSYRETRPQLPLLEQNGWNYENQMYTPLMCLLPPAPKAIIELTKCGCKSACSRKSCTCLRNEIPCAPLCKCASVICENKTARNILDGQESDEDE